MPRPRANLVLIPDGGGETRHYRIPLISRPILIGALVLFVAILCGAGLSIFKMVRADQLADTIRLENQVLRGELVSMGEQIARVDGRVSEHIALANESRLLAGLPPYSEDVSQLGVGGTPEPTSFESPEGLSPSLARSVAVYQDRLEQFNRQVGFQEQSFLEVRNLLEANREKLNHIPTINPVDGSHYLSSGFGMRRDPFTGLARHHNGVDLSAARGTPFVSAADGKIVFAGKNSGFGKTIKVDHGNGYLTVYAHAHKIFVKVGDEVRRGDLIGHVGDSGRSTGVHLHYEIHKDKIAVNPRRYFLESDPRIG